MHLRPLSRTDRKRALEALAAQLAELREAGIDPEDALGGPGDYAVALLRALADEPAEGMRQKLAIGRAIIHDSELLFLDIRLRAWTPNPPPTSSTT